MRGFLMICITATAWSSAVDAGKPPKRKAQPGYECKIEDRGNFGLIQADFQILDSGEPHTGYIKWDAGDGQFRNPWITAAFSRQKDGSYSLGNGYILIMRQISAYKSKNKPRTLKLRLELTTNPTMTFGSSRMAGNIARSGGPFHLQLNWPDAAALAAGASELYLVARNTKNSSVDQVSLDRLMFSRAEPHILSTFSQAVRMTADPRSLCVHSDDLGTDDIVVT